MRVEVVFVVFVLLLFFSGCSFLEKKSYNELDVSAMKACFSNEDCVLVTNTNSGCCQVPVSLYKDFVDGYYENYAEKIFDMEEVCRETFRYGVTCKLAKYEPACINYTCHVVDRMMWNQTVG